jgi:PHP family Zn ribbon phosphoesterase
MLLWFKYISFEKGISPREFNQISMRDIEDLMKIRTALNNKQTRKSNINQLMSKIKW